jgi:hypothetical protein
VEKKEGKTIPFPFSLYRLSELCRHYSLTPRLPLKQPQLSHKQDPRLDFAEVLKRATKTTRILKAIGVVLLTAVLAKTGWLTRPNEGAWASVAGVWARWVGRVGGKGAGVV